MRFQVPVSYNFRETVAQALPVFPTVNIRLDGSRVDTVGPNRFAAFFCPFGNCRSYPWSLEFDDVLNIQQFCQITFLFCKISQYIWQGIDHCPVIFTSFFDDGAL